ncbi:MAG: hypothetical protein JMDDDDMK_01712 [Acidobacteria bacterium]|nr:hypothetical protein [Acidobacteriota bacterium]
MNRSGPLTSCSLPMIPQQSRSNDEDLRRPGHGLSSQFRIRKLRILASEIFFHYPTGSRTRFSDIDRYLQLDHFRQSLSQRRPPHRSHAVRYGCPHQHSRVSGQLYSYFIACFLQCGGPHERKVCSRRVLRSSQPDQQEFPPLGAIGVGLACNSSHASRQRRSASVDVFFQKLSSVRHITSSESQACLSSPSPSSKNRPARRASRLRPSCPRRAHPRTARN